MLRHILFRSCLALSVALSASAAMAEQQAHQIHMMHQTSHVEVEDITRMFRFEPDYLVIQPGDTVRFSGTVGEHTITSVSRMLPEGAKAIEINSTPSKDIRFDIPGVYGLKCRVHNRYGMVALLVVGSPENNLEEARTFRLKRFGKKRMTELLDQAAEEFSLAQ
ncbi:plastocyanin/azurin family copper-binding protein [Aliamphritea hakodatensis]|uniref:plastocyanin/azurin family copper-binding protein n=1 Tax=Aliamphritea hakodatensis TaxID=2895352 RepID=UPI0022FDAC96|nr:plastocyanin/azurin family copper-binding protein [Aliamphritea hakodatensis]